MWTVAAAALSAATLGLPWAYSSIAGLLTLTFLLWLIFHWAGGEVWRTIAGYVLIAASLVGVSSSSLLRVPSCGRATRGAEARNSRVRNAQLAG